MARLKVLAIAVATCRLGYVYLHGGELVEWKMSRTAHRSPEKARAYTKRLIERLAPDVVITEKIAKRSRKGEHAKRIIAAITRIAEKANCLISWCRASSTLRTSMRKLGCTRSAFQTFRVTSRVNRVSGNQSPSPPSTSKRCLWHWR